MGLLKRDLARASAQPLPELGGVFCPLTAPLHLQEQASSLQQLAKGCTRDTLILLISCSYTSLPCSVAAMLLPWQLTDPPHPACWPLTSPVPPVIHTPLPLCIPIPKHHQPLLQNLGPHTDILGEFLSI